MFGLGFQELLIVGAIAVMLFGKRLPEVARSLGAQYQEFRKGLTEIQSQIDIRDTVYHRPGAPNSVGQAHTLDDGDDLEEPTAPKLDLPDVNDPNPTT